MREKLTAEFCTETTKTGYHADGGGLYLIVKPNGRKYWCYRWRDRHALYTTEKSKKIGKLREKGLGPFGQHDVSLTDARRLAGECRQMVRQGEDPIARARRPTRQAVAEETPALVTFGMCATRYIEAHKPTWRNEKQAAQWSATLNKYAGPLMTLPVTAVNTERVLSCLQPIWTSKTETAMRVRQRIESVLDWATTGKLREGENPAKWRGHLDQFLPKPTKLKKLKHRPALDYQRLGTFMSHLRKVDSMTARALELQILTAARPGEVVSACWSEFGLIGRIWTIPAEHTNNNLQRTVPLSLQSISLLKQLPKTTRFVFPGASKQTGMTTAAIMKLIKQIEPGITAQGFRTTFLDWATSQTDYPRDVIDYAMAQPLKEKAEAAEIRSDMIAKRTSLMGDWANYCDLRQ